MAGEIKQALKQQAESADVSPGQMAGGAIASAIAGAVMGYASVATGTDFLSALPQRQADIRKERRERLAVLNKLSLAVNEGGEETESLFMRALGDPEDPAKAIQELDAASANEIYNFYLSDRAKRTNKEEDARSLYAELAPQAEARGIEVGDVDPGSPEAVRALLGKIEAHDYQRGKSREQQVERNQEIENILSPYVDVGPGAPGYMDAFQEAVGLAAGDRVLLSQVARTDKEIRQAQRNRDDQVVATATASGDWSAVQDMWEQDPARARRSGLSSVVGSNTEYSRRMARVQNLVADGAEMPASLNSVVQHADPDKTLAEIIDETGPSFLGQLDSMPLSDLESAEKAHEARETVLPSAIREAQQRAQLVGMRQAVTDNDFEVRVVDGQAVIEPSPGLQDAFSLSYTEALAQAGSLSEIDVLQRTLENDTVLGKVAKDRIQGTIDQARTRLVSQVSEGAGPPTISEQLVRQVESEVVQWTDLAVRARTTGIREDEVARLKEPPLSNSWPVLADSAWGVARTPELEAAAFQAESEVAQLEKNGAPPEVVANAAVRATQLRRAVTQADVRQAARTRFGNVTKVIFRFDPEVDIETLVAGEVGEAPQDLQGDPGIAGLETFRQRAKNAAEDDDLYDFLDAYHGLWGANAKAFAATATSGTTQASEVTGALSGLQTNFSVRVDVVEDVVTGLLAAPDLMEEAQREKGGAKGALLQPGLLPVMAGMNAARGLFERSPNQNLAVLQTLGVPVQGKKVVFQVGDDTLEFKVADLEPRELAALAVTYHGS